MITRSNFRRVRVLTSPRRWLELQSTKRPFGALCHLCYLESSVRNVLTNAVEYDNYDATGSGVSIVRDKPTLKIGRVKEETSVSDKTLLALGAVSTAAVVGGFLLRNSKYLERIRVR